MFSIPIYGSLAIQGYGIAICIGVLLAAWRASAHSLCRAYLSAEFLFDLIAYSVYVGIIGGRLLHIATEPSNYETIASYFMLWEGGFAISGTILSLLVFIPWYTARRGMPLRTTLDLCGLYAPLVHAISRLGCFSAGCCGGIPSLLPWATYDDYGTLVHPTQLYSAAIFFILFLVLRWCANRVTYRPGMLFAWYLMGAGIERFIVDWWRIDRVPLSFSSMLSTHQIFALIIAMLGCLLWQRASFSAASSHEYL